MMCEDINSFDTKYVLKEIKEKTLLLTINRPSVLNALSPEVWTELNNVVDIVEKTESISTVIVTGSGEKAFAAGADVKSLLIKTGIENLHSVSRELLQKIEASSKIYIAAINGYAFGGGCELALACDIRIASQNAQVGLPETNLGIIPGAGGTQRLVRLTSESIAKQVILGGRILKAEDLLSFGLVISVHDSKDLIEKSFKIAQSINAKAPSSLLLAKRLINAANDIDIKSGLLFENLAFSVLLDSEDKHEGINAFLDKRKPNFIGR